MATIYKTTFTKPLPAGAELVTVKGQRCARWRSAKGKQRTAPVIVGEDGQERVTITAATFTARYRDAAGVWQRVKTGCRDEVAARAVLAEVVRRVELVNANVITPEQDAISDQQDVPFAEHVAAFVNRRTKRAPNGVSEMRQDNERAPSSHVPCRSRPSR